MAFGSLRPRAERTVATVAAHAGVELVEAHPDDFSYRSLPGLEGAGLRVVVNWSDKRATS